MGKIAMFDPAYLSKYLGYIAQLIIQMKTINGND